MTVTEIPPDEDGRRLAELFTELADDPDAPPSTVSALSVIAAARAAASGAAASGAAAGGAAAGGAAAGGAADGAGDEAGTSAGGADDENPADEPNRSSSAGELHVLAVHADAARGRRQRRRTGLIALAVAASLAGIAAIVVPLSLNRGSTTSTAADSAVEAAAAGGTVAAVSAGAAGGTAAAGASAAGAQPGDAAAQGKDSAASEAAGALAGAAPGAAGNASPERPPPGPDALTALVPVDGVTPAAQTPAEPGAPAEASCWPALSDQTAAALAASLPAGAFGPPTTLTTTCGPDPVGGAALAGTAPGTALVVRVSKAAEGACAKGNSEAGVRCVPRQGGVYVATDGSGQAVAFAYGNGNEVVVGGPSVQPGAISAPPVSSLSADQLVLAAQAVLGTVG